MLASTKDRNDREEEKKNPAKPASGVSFGPLPPATAERQRDHKEV